jgi:hypothetical protein
MRTRGAAIPVAVACIGVVLTSGALPAVAQATGKASVVNHRATMDPGGGVPVKVHCAASKQTRCAGSLRLVTELVPGTTVSSPRQAFVVPGGKTRTVRIQASGAQIERLLQGSPLSGVVKVKERKPQTVPAHPSPITVHLPIAS